MRKSKVVKTRKDHKCGSCGVLLKKGSVVKSHKIYPAEAKSWGMIDVSLPLTDWYCLEGCKK
jgi:hypothetical protein